jgi:hypothetical protein
MPFWIMLLINVITFLVTELLRPKPNIEDAKPAGLGDFNVPTATEGRAVPLIWGRVRMGGPNVVWYGDLVAEPITERVKTGLFSKETVTTGFRYFIGLQMALCRGPVDLLVNIRNDDSFAWGEDAPSADANLVPTDAGAIYFIDEPEFYGGEESGGGGGLVGGGRIFPGTETQAISGYLAPFQIPTPAYRGTCFVTWERGEIGLAPQLRNFAFEIERIPDGLDLATLQAGDEEIDLGANPMNVVFEALTNTEWGLARASGDVDLVNFRAQAAILATEGNGFAWVWDRQQDVLELIKLVEQQVDGILTVDAVTGLFSFTLVRFDYVPGTLPLLDESNIKSVTRFQRPTWAETQNQIQVEFTDRRKNYTTSFALAQDMANQDIVKAINAAKIRSPGVKNPTLANSIAWREIRALSTPIVTMKLVTDRSQFDVQPGDVLEFSWARFGITRLPIRITSVDRGKILENEMTIDAVQDVFSFNAGSYSDPTDTGWVPISSEAQPSFRERLWEVPQQLSLDKERHLAVLCSRDGGLHISFDVLSDRVGTPFGLEGTEQDFTPTALITAAISRDKGDVNPFRQDISVDVLNDIRIQDLVAVESTTIDGNNPGNVFLIDEELFFFETAVDDGGGQFTLGNCHSGMFDTVPADHLDNAEVWFIGLGLGLLQRAGPLPSPPGNIDVKILPQTIRNRLAEGSAATLSTTVVQRILNPIPPGDPFVNGFRFHDLDGWTRAVGTLDMIWNTRNRSTQTFDTKQDDPDIQQSGDVGAHVIVRRVDTSATVVDRLNIFSDQFIVTDFIPQSSPGIPDELDFTVEITNRTTAGAEGQVATTREFEVFGFGINFGGDFGGDPALPNNGIVLPQGAPPFTPDPVPGSGDDRIWTLDFLGSFDAGEDRRLLFNFFDGLTQESINFNIFLASLGVTTLTEIAEGVRAFLETNLVDRPFTITREGTTVTVTTRFGDMSLRQQPKSNIVPLNFMLGIGFRQEASPPRAAVRQKLFVDWFRQVSAIESELSDTNEPAFLLTSPTSINILAFGGSALTFEQEQEAGGREGFFIQISVPQPGTSDDRTQFHQEFYDGLRSSAGADFLELIQGPLVLIPGFDFPMARASIALEVRDNFKVRLTEVANSNSAGIAYDAGGRGPGFGIPGLLKFIVREGTPPVAGLPGGLAQVNTVGVVNRGADVGVTLSYTLAGTVFSEITISETNNYRAAWGRLLDQIDLDARFDVINRLDEITRLSLRAEILRTVGNAPFEVFADVGFGLRVEFRDVSP